MGFCNKKRAGIAGPLALSDVYGEVVDAVFLEFRYIFVHTVRELREILRVGVFEMHVAPGELLSKDVEKHGVLVIGYRLVYAALLKGL